MVRKRSGGAGSGKRGFLGKMRGLHKYSKVLADGSRTWYYKVSREKGAPVFWQTERSPEPEPVSEEFQSAYQHAKQRWILDRQGLAQPGTLAAMRAPWIESLRQKGRAKETIEEYERSLEFVLSEFGTEPLVIFTEPEMRKDVKKWHRTFMATPRAADHRLGTLVALLNFAIDEGEMARHVIGNIERLYDADRSDIIVEPDELEAALAVMPLHASLGIRFAAHSGFRRKDCVRVPITAIQGGEIIWATSKSRGRQDYCMPITDATAQILDELDHLRRSLDAPPTTLLFNSRGKPWTPPGLSRHLERAFKKTGVEGKRFHDLRGTAATNYALAGFDDEDIAEFLGWKTEQVKQIIKRYVGREALVQRRVVQLRGNAKGTNR
ncbi:MAG: tyrosine-type recombinase/integrase [Devosiaceae bacterium]|nr:tyrosine-type recombinase/integrase [Devosiaceae bacterium MH13]